jgi:ElaB/YqjD/DUF883 family membrane-anchored ribosome-binding protein
MTTSREQMGREAEQTAAKLEERGREVSYRAGEGFESVKHTLASGLHSAAERMREQPAGGGQPSFFGRVAEPLDRSARYLEEHSLPEISQDATEYAREHPITTAAGVFTAAFLLGRLLRRR